MMKITSFYLEKSDLWEFWPKICVTLRLKNIEHLSRITQVRMTSWLVIGQYNQIETMPL